MISNSDDSTRIRQRTTLVPRLTLRTAASALAIVLKDA